MLNKNFILLLAAYGLTAASNIVAVHEITTLKEYRELRERPEKMVIAFKSPTCGACKPNEEALEKSSGTAPSVKIYTLDITKKDAKGKQVFEGLAKEIKLEAYPTTHFIEPDKKPRVERGSMSVKEIDDALYEMEHGKKKAVIPKKLVKEQQ